MAGRAQAWSAQLQRYGTGNAQFVGKGLALVWIRGTASRLSRTASTHEWNSPGKYGPCSIVRPIFFLRVFDRPPKPTPKADSFRALDVTRSKCVAEQYTHKYSTYRVAQIDHISSREHAWLKSWKAQDCTSLCR